MTQIRPRLEFELYNAIRDLLLDKSKINLLVVPDLHEPFTRPGYFEFVKRIANKYQTKQTVFLGDIMDMHATSYHEKELDALSPDEEFMEAKRKVNRWVKEYPEADVMIGNHDGLKSRKAKTAGISSHWVKSYNEALDAPNWNFVESITYNGVLFRHGIGGKARSYMKDQHCSVVQGHFHSETELTFNPTPNTLLFAMQLGCGIDKEAYAMRYGKNFKRPLINVGVILDLYGSPVPIIEHMDLCGNN